MRRVSWTTRATPARTRRTRSTKQRWTDPIPFRSIRTRRTARQGGTSLTESPSGNQSRRCDREAKLGLIGDAWSGEALRDCLWGPSGRLINLGRRNGLGQERASRVRDGDTLGGSHREWIVSGGADFARRRGGRCPCCFLWPDRALQRSRGEKDSPNRFPEVGDVWFRM